MNLFKLAATLIFLLCITGLSYAGDTSTGYDIFLLVGQSNMAGRGYLSATDPEPVSQWNTDIKMWDHAQGKMVQAKDPIIHQEPLMAGRMGLGMSFANAHMARMRGAGGFPNRKILLVGAAWGGTGFQASQAHNWTPTGDLAAGAIKRANAAIAAALAAEPTSRFQGILWHQGETDIAAGDIVKSPTYQSKLAQLISSLRSNIKLNGVAVTNAVLVIGVPTACFMSYCPNSPAGSTSGNAADRASFLTMANGIQNVIAHAGCVGNTSLTWNSGTDGIHYDRSGQRAMGKRYQAKFLDLVHGVAQTGCSSN
jgi:hypothetical protein